MDLPRIVWMLWLQGMDDAPPMVQTCVRSWVAANPGWEVRVLDRESVSTYVDLAAHFPHSTSKSLTTTDQADLTRSALLFEHGGVWADATLFCAVGLDEWLPDLMTSGFFAFDRPEPDRMLANWFLAAQPQHPLVGSWNRRVDAYWSLLETADQYFWHHACFADVYEHDESVRRAWDATPKVSADGPHFFYPYDPDLIAPLDDRQTRRLLSARDPVYKLSNKVDVSVAAPRSAYFYFTDQVSPRSAPPPSEALRATLVRFRDAGGRILLHAGAPKTGSTSMQNVLHDHRGHLLEHGICYASNISVVTKDPKHQWLVFLLQSRDADALEAKLGTALEEAIESGATTLLLSTEGLYNHWVNYASWAGPWFRGIAAEIPLEVWLLLREPASFVAALYQQVLRNPQVGPQVNGRAITAAEMLERGAFVLRLDYDAVVTWWEDVVGPDNVRTDVYVSSLAPLVRSVLGVPDLPWPDVRDNRSLSGVGCALLLQLNACSLPPAEREQILEHVIAIDALATSALGRQHVLTDDEAQRARDIMRPSLERLICRRPVLSPLLTDA